MKTAISVPNAIFEAAERFAQQTGKSRSQLFSEAMAEYLARHLPDQITAAMNETIDAIDEEEDLFLKKAARRRLEQSEW